MHIDPAPPFCRLGPHLRHSLLLQINASKRIMYYEEAALQTPPLPIRKTDIVQVWSNEAALHTVLNGTQASVVVSWADVSLNCMDSSTASVSYAVFLCVRAPECLLGLWFWQYVWWQQLV